MKCLRIFGVVLAGGLSLASIGCNTQPVATRTFQDDVNFLSRNVYTVVLTDMRGQSQVAVVPKFQGTVMTSSADGIGGQSFGYIDYDLIKSKNVNPQFNMVGGEDRVFVGPGAGHFGIDFAAGAEFSAENLQVPAALDREAWDIVGRGADHVTLQKKFSVTNYSNKTFQLRLTRTVRVLPREEAWTELGARGGEKASVVAYESKNELVNASHTSWRKEEGLLNLTVVGMFRRSSDVAMVLPTMNGKKIAIKRADPHGILDVPGATLVSAEQAAGRVVQSPGETRGVLGSYDPATGTLTVVQFEPIQPNGPYMSSDWQPQRAPYQGDASGVASGSGLGYFMLTSSSPALQIDGWTASTFTSRTYHIQGKPEDLEPIARSVLGVGLDQIRMVVPAPTK